MANVLLLRSTSQDGPDKYEEAFRSRGYTPISVPVLETVLKNLGDLKGSVLEGPFKLAFGGVIVTSARACEAWRVVMQEITDATSGPRDSGVSWSTVPFYVVGEATAKVLSEIYDAFPGSPYTPRDIRGAAESGTSERLAKFILEDLKDASGSKKLLYLTGDKNRDTLPNILAGGGFSLESLQVYESQGSSRFAEDLRQVLTSKPSGSDRWWIVYFAPSAADFVTPILRKHFNLQGAEPEQVNGGSLSTPQIAAIGPTTSTFLRDTLRLNVNVVPTRPVADALVSAIVHLDGGPRS
ncbi:tetrapyrrole biosynthesis uroporphyrinogen III synthase [Obba rivulosa]|uniref:Tetrapyrrole biosynthesis uroporphyrinogen III synthase n=1 Tax=Obba rivulosa TaxID=1052685 RepID=A0A8E2DG72_9APHY|nr:tetrapyrrole biosynthesis uroporphyrinogen III synthase [Obba rivulosa]